jgi:hypothetical protein
LIAAISVATSSGVGVPTLYTNVVVSVDTVTTGSEIGTPSPATVVYVATINTVVSMPSPTPILGGSGNYVRGRLTITVRERTMAIVVREAVEVAP